MIKNESVEKKPSDYFADELSETEGSVVRSNSLEEPLLRKQWKRKLDFFIACMAYSIGLGNVWRFPYLCYKNGGGAFLIPYVISIILAGIPMFVLEVSIGQLMSRGGIAAWDLCPLFRGIGCASIFVCFLTAGPYSVILTWALHYLFASFTSVLPWTKCDEWWNTPNCRLNSSYVNRTQTAGNGSVVDVSVLASDPVTEYWENRVLGLSSGIETGGTVRWDLALCLLLAWLITFVCICRGLRASGKILYFTAIAPYIFMIILLIRTSLLEGARDGIIYYLQPDWVRLADLRVWADAGTQIFYSYALSLGALTALGSYNTFHHNSFRDCCLFAVTNSVTSFMAGFVIFATLGNMSYKSNVPIALVAESGPGLAFLIYPKALGTMPGSPFWSICFFLMLLLLGIDSLFAGVESVTTALADYLPRIHTSTRFRCLIVASFCLSSFLVGLSMVTNGGMYVFQIFDYYSGSRIILIVAFLEAIVVGYFYGAPRFTKHMHCMYGINLRILPTLFWCFITPVFTGFLFILSAVKYQELSYRRAGQTIAYQFPDWSVKLGWLMASSSVIVIPITMIVQILRTPGGLCQRVRFLLKPQLPEDTVQRLEDFAITHKKEKASNENSTKMSFFKPKRAKTDVDIPTSKV